jgi:hypothetical protein
MASGFGVRMTLAACCLDRPVRVNGAASLQVSHQAGLAKTGRGQEPPFSQDSLPL